MVAQFNRFIDALVTLAFIVAAIVALAIMVIGSVDVIGTFVFNAPLSAAVEAQEALMAIVIFLAFASAQHRREHIDVDIVKKMFPPTAQRVLTVLATIITMGIFALIGWRATVLALDSLAIRETAAAVFAFPLYPGKLLVALGSWVAALECLRQIVNWFARGEEHVEGARIEDRGV